MTTHLGTLLVDLVVHHAAEDVLVCAPALRPAGVCPTLRIFVLASVCTCTLQLTC